MNKDNITPVKLTHFSHGSGCGCKIAPNVLEKILSNSTVQAQDDNLLVGNDTNDDAAVYRLDEKTAIISTTDFFTPIVDDPFDYGAIAAVNALSDIYAMGGMPMMAISILGWPIDKLGDNLASHVVDGAKAICSEAGIVLAGGHSIDSPEPIFGLAVTGRVNAAQIKRNNTATPGNLLYLTKPLGIGVMTTAQKSGDLDGSDLRTVTALMKTLNKIGATLSQIEGVEAMTDVTGFGLLGHLIEMCEGSAVSAEVEFDNIPRLPNLEKYLKMKTFPGGTFRNFKSYGEKATPLNEVQKAVLCDPQTSGGLLIAVKPEVRGRVEQILTENGIHAKSFGEIGLRKEKSVYIF